MSGWSLFWARLRARPIAAVGSLAFDYVLFVAACWFTLALLIVRWPLYFLDRITGWRVRARMIELVSRASHG